MVLVLKRILATTKLCLLLTDMRRFKLEQQLTRSQEWRYETAFPQAEGGQRVVKASLREPWCRFMLCLGLGSLNIAEKINWAGERLYPAKSVLSQLVRLAGKLFSLSMLSCRTGKVVIRGGLLGRLASWFSSVSGAWRTRLSKHAVSPSPVLLQGDFARLSYRKGAPYRSELSILSTSRSP